MDVDFNDLRRRLPERNTGLVDRVLRAIMAACTFGLLGYGVLGAGVGLFELIVAFATLYLGFTAATGRDFLYHHLRLDTRSEAEVEADQMRDLRAADEASARLAAQRLAAARYRSGGQVAQPNQDQWGHSVLGR